jgi:hypothetical protein
VKESGVAVNDEIVGDGAADTVRSSVVDADLDPASVTVTLAVKEPLDCGVHVKDAWSWLEHPFGRPVYA